MNYDIQIGNTIRRGITYAELVSYPIGPDTYVRRANGEWMYAKDCIELTHILADHTAVSSCTLPNEQNRNVDYLQEQHIDEDDYEIDDCSVDDIEYADEYTSQFSTTANTPSSILPPDIRYDSIEERIFLPTAEYFKCKQKRKAAIMGVCTLGLAGLSMMGVGNTWRSNIFAGTSFSAHTGMAFVLKCLSFCFLTALIAIPYFIYSVFALIYYSIRLSNLKH